MEEAYVDLHTHTIHSDGTLSAEDVVRNAAFAGTQVLAITDHDTLAGWEAAQESAGKFGMTLIPGVEITTSKHHILGLGVDACPGGCFNEKLKGFLAEGLRNRLERIGHKVRGLQEMGWPVVWENICGNLPDDSRWGLRSWGTYNLLLAVMQDWNCQQYFAQNGMSVRDVERAVRDVPARFRKHSSGAAIRAIHDAGGLAVVAHPFKGGTLEELEKLVAKGLDGVEVQPNYGERNRPFEEYARQKGLLVTYGSDFHNPVKNRPLLGSETRNGYTPKMRLEDVARLQKNCLREKVFG